MKKQLRPIEEIRFEALGFRATEVVSRIKYFKSLNVDFDVFLETKNRNLQRDFVWDINQKRELINSVLIRRHIPHLSIINIINPSDTKKDIYQIIDGKQRLSTIFNFIDDKFDIILEGESFLYSELPPDYKLAVSNYEFRYYIVNEEWGNKIADEQKISWFKFINFAGTPQDKEYLDSL